MSHRIVAFLLALSLVLSSRGSTHAKPAAAPAAAPEPAFSSVMFIENVGQFAEGARFQVWGGPAGTMWLADDAIWLTVVEPRSEEAAPSSGDPKMRIDLPLADAEGKGAPRNAINIKLSFVGANPHPRIEPLDRLDTVVSYFIGNEPEKWRPDVPVWGGVRYVDLYPGVDLEVTSEGGQMIQRVATRPGADLSAVQLRVEGVNAVVVDGDALRLSTVAGEAILPLLQAVGTSNKATAQSSYDRTFDVTTPFTSTRVNPKSTMPETTRHAVADLRDPFDNSADLLYGTFLGGSGNDDGVGIAVDAAGRAYVTGDTGFSDFPTTPGVFDPSYNGSADVFLARLNVGGSVLEYATFLGGSNYDIGWGIAVDAGSRAYVTGYTDSSDFPTTLGAFDASSNGGVDAFVVRLNAAGSALEYATFLGGNIDDYGYGIAVDTAGRAYVTGDTASSSFPTTLGALDRSFNGGYDDAFVVRLNAAGSTLEYATFLGGSDYDYGYGVAVDGPGRAYVTGGTKSRDFPTTSGTFDTIFGGWIDVFVIQLNAEGSVLEYATFLGGGNYEWGRAIALDEAGQAYVTGVSYSSDFPTTSGAFDTSYGGVYDAFVIKLSSTGTGLVYATFLGGSSGDDGIAIAVDALGWAYVTGGTNSSDFPTTLGAFDASSNGGVDAFVVRLNAAGSALEYATFLGGGNNDLGRGIALDAAGRAYVTGCTASSYFPTTPAGFDTSFNGGSGPYGDTIVVKLATGPALPVDAAELASQAEYPTVAPGATVSFRIEVRNTGTTTWRASDGYGWRGDDQWLGQSGAVTGETSPGGIWRLETTLTAPTTPGEYVYGFMLRHGTQEFGPYFSIKVTVKQPSATDFRADPNGFKVANTTLFRDWPMFRQAFGATNVERPNGKPCAAADAYFYKNYRAVAGGWSCVGFSSASMISFLGWSQPKAGQYAIPAYPRLYDQPWSTTLSHPIAYYAGTQEFKQYADEYGQWLASCDQNPTGLVERIKQNLESGEPMLLSLSWGQGNHAVTPYNVMYTSATEAQVYVYDSEAPGNNEKTIRFTRNGSEWQWKYTFVGSLAFAGEKTGGCQQMFGVKLRTLLEQGQPPVNWCAAGTSAMSAGASDPIYGTQTASGRMVIHFPPEGDVIVRDAQGRRLGWIAGQLVSEIPNAISVPQATTSVLSASRSFYVPVGAYTLDTAQQTNGNVDTAAFGDGRVVMLEGKASAATSLQISSDLAESVIANPAAFESLNTTLIEEQPTSSTVALVSVTQPTGASPLTLRSSGNQMTLARPIGTLNYTLAYRNSGALDFVSPKVALGANESHKLTYDGSTVLLQIDRGRDGTIDETRTLPNEVKRVYLPVIRR